MKCFNLNKKGFTLVELLAVIVVLALLMVVAGSSIGTALTNSKKSSLRLEAKKLYDGLEKEIQTYAMLGTITKNTVNTQLNSRFNGKDGDFTYYARLGENKFEEFNICYKREFIIIWQHQIKAFSEIQNISDGYEHVICDGGIKPAENLPE